ncbi:MAG: hypothetical protein A2V66_07670 [Ignavibacteria bacterium RBG_13_36_8]|nr:MAG: hypothetical protein A2V66_07670 [Ignavibacteria bacterium RBG_13_36_8]
MKRKKKHPPTVAYWLLKVFTSDWKNPSLVGDLEEEFYDIAVVKGYTYARVWYVIHVLKSIPKLIKDSNSWGVFMFKNYLTIAWRTIRNHKGYSLINVFGLATGLACCLTIFIWIQDEFQYDQFQVNKDRIFQVYSQMKTANSPSNVFTGSFYPLAQAIKEDIPGVEQACKFRMIPDLPLRYNENTFSNTKIGFADASFFKTFSFPLYGRDAEIKYDDKFSIYLTEATAHKLFGSENPLGKIVKVNNQVDLTVKGVLLDVPPHSSIQFDCVVPFELMFPPNFVVPTHWGGNPFMTFILLNNNIDNAGIEKGITDIFYKYNNKDQTVFDFHLHPFTKLHISPAEGGGLYTTIIIFSIVAVFVLLVACINFMNLSTARSSIRIKEIGMRKVIGATKSNLRNQFLSESILLTIISLIVGLSLVALFLPTFNSIAEKNLDLTSIASLNVIVSIVVITLITGLISGSYPALYLSSFSSVGVLKQKFSSGKGSKLFRNILVVAQFTLTSFLLIGLFTVNQQLSYILSKDYGFQRDNLVIIQMTDQLKNHYNAIKSELKNNSGIVNVTKCAQNPISIGSSVFAVDWDGKDPSQNVSFSFDVVYYDYFETFGMTITGGRAFSNRFPSDIENGFIVNEEAVKTMGLTDPIGKRLRVFSMEGTIVGVVKDFHFQSFQNKIQPFVFMCDPSWDNWMFIKIQPNNVDQSLEYIRTVCGNFEKEIETKTIFFNDALMRHIYTTENQVSRIVELFTILIAFISSLGLLGLTIFVAEQERKEIAIRKTLGSTVIQVVRNLSKDITARILLANLIAFPLAYFATQKLLRMYAYRIDTDWGIYLLTCAGTLALAIITISYHSIKAAIANPVNSLRNE